ncbi:MAG: NAD(P)H-hydrate dehydratase [Enterococcus sp.]|nr:NAD(P)H-hydrate dehydratase [Enterococcus sp.]
METLDASCLKIIKKRARNSHKGHYGRVLLIGGNEQYGGAIIMSAESCVKAGAGLVTVATHVHNHSALHARLPEAMVIDWTCQTLLKNLLKQSDVLIIGPGLGLNSFSLSLLAFVLKNQQKHQWLVIDGSALTLFAQEKLTLPFPTQTVLTPHQMEWQRVSQIEIAQQTVANNQAKQAALQAIVVLKSHQTTIYAGEIGTYLNPLGNPAMATGGTGDTLCGIIGSFLAQFSKEVTSVLAAVYLHSLIGDALAKENYVVLPTEISAALPLWMKKFEMG